MFRGDKHHRRSNVRIVERPGSSMTWSVIGTHPNLTALRVTRICQFPQFLETIPRSRARIVIQRGSSTRLSSTIASSARNTCQNRTPETTQALLHPPRNRSFLADSAAAVSVQTRDKKWYLVLPVAVTTTAGHESSSRVVLVAFIAPPGGASLPLANDISCCITPVPDHLNPVRCPTRVL